LNTSSITDNELQLKIIYLYLFDQEFFLSANKYISPDLFTNRIIQRSVEIVEDYYYKYGGIFNKDQTVFSTLLLNDPIASQSQLQVESFLTALNQLEVTKAEAAFLIDHIAEVSKQRRAINLLPEGANLIKEGKVDEFVAKVVTELGDSKEAFEELDLFADNMEAVARILHGVEKERISTLIPALDKSLHGGLGAEELVVVVGGAGKGKTTFLINLGWAAMLQGKNVLYVTLEVSRFRIYQRTWSLATGLSVDYIMQHTEEAVERIKQHKLKKAWGKFKVIESPKGVTSVINIDSYIDKVYYSQNFAPDLLIVDYGDLLRPVKHYESDWKEAGEIFSDLRRIAVKRQISVVTASQLNREGAKKTLAKGTDISRSWSKVADADVVLILNRTEEDDMRNRMRILVDKNRNYLSGAVIEVFTDFEHMKIGEIFPTIKEEKEEEYIKDLLNDDISPF